MAFFGSLLAMLKMDATQWSKGHQQARDELDKTAKKSKVFFADLKSGFGKGSFLGQSLELMAGSGAIAGLSMAMNKVVDLTEKIKELADGVRAGTVKWDSFADSLIKSIPIMGQVYQATRNLQDAITGAILGDKDTGDQDLAAAKRMKAIVDAGAKGRAEIAKVLSESNKKLMYDAVGESGKPFLDAEYSLMDALGKIKAAEDAAKASLDNAQHAYNESAKKRNISDMINNELTLQAAKTNFERTLAMSEKATIAARKAYQNDIDAAQKEYDEKRDSAIRDQNKKAVDTEIAMMQRRADELQAIADEQNKRNDPVSAVMTSAVRMGGGTVKVQPQPDDSTRKFQSELVGEIKGLRKDIKAFDDQYSDVQVVF